MRHHFGKFFDYGEVDDDIIYMLHDVFDKFIYIANFLTSKEEVFSYGEGCVLYTL